MSLIELFVSTILQGKYFAGLFLSNALTQRQ